MSVETESPSLKPRAILLRGVASGGWDVWAIFGSGAELAYQQSGSRRTLIAVLISLMGKELARQVALTIAKGYGLDSYREE